MPPAAARSRMATEVASSHCRPKVMVPRQSRETGSPVRPRRTWRIRDLLLHHADVRPHNTTERCALDTRTPGGLFVEPADDFIQSSATRCDRQDRKSTRLNSSHQIISYAVFCL